MSKLPTSPPIPASTLSHELATLAASFQPRTFSLAWFLKLPARLWRGSKLMILWSALLGALAAGRAATSRLSRRLHAVSAGLEIAWELSGVAFRWFIDRELWQEIKESPLSRQVLGLGVLTTLVWFLYDLRHGFSVEALVFFVYQALRALAFLGMEGGPLTPKPAPLENGARRRVVTYDELHGEEDDD